MRRDVRNLLRTDAATAAAALGCGCALVPAMLLLSSCAASAQAPKLILPLTTLQTAAAFDAAPFFDKLAEYGAPHGVSERDPEHPQRPLAA